MAKYSSDSDSEQGTSKYHRKHTRRSSSLDSSDNSSYQRRVKYSKVKKYQSRSRSKDRCTKYKHTKSSSKERRRYHFQKSRSTSGDRNYMRKRPDSKEKLIDRTSTSQSNIKILNCAKPSSTSIDNHIISDTKIKISILNEIDNSTFIPKQFSSSVKIKETKMKNIVIDINDDTIHIPQVTNTFDTFNSIFHTSIMVDKEMKFDKWVKKLYSLRQKVVNEFNCN